MLATAESRTLDSLSFELPAHLEAEKPAEARGLTRDAVRLLVSYRSDNRLLHAHFHDLPHVLEAGDVLLINTSGTMKAALPVELADGREMRLHLSNRLPAGRWIVELRSLVETSSGDATTAPYFEAVAGEQLRLPGGGSGVLHRPANSDGRNRLWIASLTLPLQWQPYLQRYGSPIRYSYVAEQWPASAYQTVFANELGSAEMPSAGRPFTAELVTRLVAKGIQFAPLLLHTGVASLEADEPPYEEYYRVPLQTANLVNAAIRDGRRIIAVGTTAVRAIESSLDANGMVKPSAGWTDLIITPERGTHVVNGLVTGLHEPKATHLAMLEALSNREHLRIAYEEALAEQYLWHEFGDTHLILP